jgi:hypothetical protein
MKAAKPLKTHARINSEGGQLNYLLKGTDPLKIAKVIGHKDAEMFLKVYGKCIDDGIAIED